MRENNRKLGCGIIYIQENFFFIFSIWGKKWASTTKQIVIAYGLLQLLIDVNLLKE